MSTTAILCTYHSKETYFNVFGKGRGPTCQIMTRRNSKTFSPGENTVLSVKQTETVQQDLASPSPIH